MKQLLFILIILFFYVQCNYTNAKGKKKNTLNNSISIHTYEGIDGKKSIIYFDKKLASEQINIEMGDDKSGAPFPPLKVANKEELYIIAKEIFNSKDILEYKGIIITVFIDSSGKLLQLRYWQASNFTKKITLKQIQLFNREVKRRIKFEPNDYYKNKPLSGLRYTFPVYFRNIEE